MLLLVKLGNFYTSVGFNVFFTLQVPYVGLNFSVYESLKVWIAKKNKDESGVDSELDMLTKLGCGAAAGMVGQTVAYPLDVVRRRLQMVGWKDASNIITADGQVKAPVQYTGMTDAFRKTVTNEGFGALYKGLIPNSVKVLNQFLTIIFSLQIDLLRLSWYGTICLLMQVVPSIAIAFVTYELVKDHLGVEFRISD